MTAARRPDDVVAALAKLIGSTRLQVLAIWPTLLVDDLTKYDQLVYFGPTVSPAFRRRLKEMLSLHGISLLARYAITRDRPFTLSEALQRLQPKGSDRWVFDLLREFRMRDGLWCTYGRWMVAYVAATVLQKKAALSRGDRMALDVLGRVATLRIQEMTRGPKRIRGVDLTPREEAVLRHLANGLDGAAIAKTLDVGQPTVRKFIRSAMKKLGAKNIAHAVSIAIRRKLI